MSSDLFEMMGLPPVKFPETPESLKSPNKAPAPKDKKAELMMELLRNPELAYQIASASMGGLPQPGQPMEVPLPPAGAPPFDRGNVPPMPTLPGKTPV